MTRQAPTGAERAQGGLEELYRRHVDEAVRLAYLLTGDRSLAEDLVQDAFETHDAVLEAASKLDFDALETLIDPDHFA